MKFINGVKINLTESPIKVANTNEWKIKSFSPLSETFKPTTPKTFLSNFSTNEKVAELATM